MRVLPQKIRPGDVVRVIRPRSWAGDVLVLANDIRHVDRDGSVFLQILTQSGKVDFLELEVTAIVSLTGRSPSTSR